MSDDWDMLRVVFDTTVFCNDFWFTDAEAQRSIEAAASGNIVIHVSEIVVAETKRRYREDASAAAQEVQSKARALQGGRFGNIVTADIRGDVQRATDAYPERFDQLLAHDGIIIDPYPDVSHQDVVQRDLERRRPFRISGKGSTGYRDTLIWESLVETALRYPDDQIVFVTDNSADYCESVTKSERRGVEKSLGAKGERGGEEHLETYELARDLREELAARTGPAGPSISIVRNLRDLTNIYLPPVSEAGGSYLIHSYAQDPQTLLRQSPEARATLLEALFETAPLLRRHQFARVYNPKEGDYDPPEVDLEIPEWIDEPTLDSIEGPSDMVINYVEETQSPGEWIANTTHLAMLTFDGFALKADLYIHDDPNVDVLEFDWNDHMAHVSTSRVVAVVSDVRCTFEDNDLTEATPVQLESISFIPSS